MLVPTLCLLSSLQGNLVLPPRPKPAEPARAQQPEQLSEFERYHRDVVGLRRSLQLSRAARDLLLDEIGARYADPAAQALVAARRDREDLLYGSLLVLERFGSAEHVEELLYLVLTRPLGAATRQAVEVVAHLAAERGKETLMNCLSARYAGVRKAATDLLLARIDNTDLDRVLELSRSQEDDVRRKALYLLGALPAPASQERLIEALHERDSTIASTACRSLVAHGPEVAPRLVAIVNRPALGRNFGYAAFALTMLEDQTGSELLTDSMVANLRVELTGNDPFGRATAALALANLAFRSDDALGARYGDRDIVEGLLLVVAPRAFVSNISMLQQPATTKLTQFTGVDMSGRNSAWHVWWEKQRGQFVGSRLAVAITAESAARATLTWVGVDHEYRFFGESAEWTDASLGDEVDRFVLSGAELDALVRRLRELGFMTTALLTTAAAEVLPSVRSLQLEVDGARSKISGPGAGARWMDAFAAEIGAVVQRERWQLYAAATGRDEVLEYWRSERQWLADHEDPVERERRLLGRVLARLPALAGARRERAMQHLMALAVTDGVMQREHGAQIVELLRRREEIDAHALQLLEAGMLVPGGDYWRELLAVVEERYDAGGKEALPGVFALLGAERVRLAIGSERPRLAVAAMIEAANLRDLGAVDVLLPRLDGDDPEVVEAAIYALGRIGAPAARPVLLAMETDPEVEIRTRRVIWVALARIGGDRVFEILQSAVASPALPDQMAALQALGELDELRAAHVLAQVLVSHGISPRGTQAIASLQKMGALLAGPALRRHLGVRDARVRGEIVQLLAEFQDPTVVPDLIALLEDEPERTRTVLLLAGITGVDLAQQNDRVAFMREWWRSHKDLPQGVWYLECLQANQIPTALAIDDLAPKIGFRAVPELTRVLLETHLPHVRVMTAAMLRETTARDFGPVSLAMTPSTVQALADRYRYYADIERGVGR